jgi:hypothetical protein
LGELTKSDKRRLREIASEAYARELHEALGDLDSAFSDWRARHIDGFQLSDFIHEFHDGISRDLFVLYTRSDPGILVARALARELLREREVPAKLRNYLSGQVAYFRDHAEEPDGE